MFETVRLTDLWSVEVSGGLRYNHFDEQSHDAIPLGDRNNSFDGWGGVVGLEGRRSLPFVATGGIFSDSVDFTSNPMPMRLRKTWWFQVIPVALSLAGCVTTAAKRAPTLASSRPTATGLVYRSDMGRLEVLNAQ